MGFAKWKFPCRLNKEQEAQWEATAARRGPYPEGTNGQLQADILRQLWANRIKWINHEKTFRKFLNTLRETSEGLGSSSIIDKDSSHNGLTIQIYFIHFTRGSEIPPLYSLS